MAGEFYAIRYLEGVPLKERHHSRCVGRFESWVAAEDARAALDKPELLEVVVRGGESK